MRIWFGPHVADDSDLRLCGDLAGKRAIELGISHPPHAPGPNSIEMALAGAKAMAATAGSLDQAVRMAESSVRGGIGAAATTAKPVKKSPSTPTLK